MKVHSGPGRVLKLGGVKEEQEALCLRLLAELLQCSFRYPEALQVERLEDELMLWQRQCIEQHFLGSIWRSLLARGVMLVWRVGYWRQYRSAEEHKPLYESVQSLMQQALRIKPLSPRLMPVDQLVIQLYRLRYLCACKLQRKLSEDMSPTPQRIAP